MKKPDAIVKSKKKIYIDMSVNGLPCFQYKEWIEYTIF